MENLKNTTRIALGLTSILFGIALVLFALGTRGALMRIGVAGPVGLMDLLVLAGPVAPLVLVGVHTLFLRPRRDPYWNDKILRAIGVAQLIGLVTHVYRGFSGGGGTSLAYLGALFIIGWVCIGAIRRAPGGLDVAPLPHGDLTPR